MICAPLSFAPCVYRPRGNGLENHVHRRLAVVRGKGQIAREHLVHENAKRPPVGALVMPLTVDHLGRHVLHRAAERVRLAVGLVCVLFAQAKIRQGNVTFVIQQNVFRLEIAVGKKMRKK